MNAVELNHVSKHYKGFSLQDITFPIKKGYINGFIGPNGAGKTTVIKLIMNLIHHNEGNIQLFGMEYKGHEKEIKERIGFVYDDNIFYEHVSLKDLNQILSRFYKKWDQGIFDRYLKEFSLPQNKKLKELSKGMKMKFSLAVALSHHAELIIMDEPTAGLDPVFRREIIDIFTDLLQDEQKTIFFSTHLTSDLDRVADYISFINEGKIVFSKSKEEIFEQYAIIKGGRNLLDADIRKEFVAIRETSVGFEGLTRNRNHGLQLFSGTATIEQPTLEDIMYYTVKGEKSCSR